MSDSIPAGFEPWKPVSHYMKNLARMGRIYWRESDLAFGVRTTHEHGNLIGVAHGGFLATMADCVLGQVIVREMKVSVVTVQLGVEYLNAVREGDWIEARAHIDKPGKRLVHATCTLEVAGRVALKATGVFAVISQTPAPTQEFDG